VAKITKEEVKNALFQMHLDKASGPDCFNSAFCQHFWELCGNDNIDAVKQWLQRDYFSLLLSMKQIFV
jgi:hypothetical protein